MTDTVPPVKRSEIMAKVKSHGNKSTELQLIKIFKESGIKGWRRRYRLIGNPDFVFPPSRLAIFVDGCFWHGCKEHCRLPATNRKYWNSKIDKNVKRDELITCQLRERHWVVIRIWEHELRKNRSKGKIQKIKEITGQIIVPDNV